MRVQNGKAWWGAMRSRWTKASELTENLILSVVGVIVEWPSLALQLLQNNFLPLLLDRNSMDWVTKSSLNSTLESKRCHRSPGLFSCPVQTDTAMAVDLLWGHGWVQGKLWSYPCLDCFPDKQVLSRTGEGEAAVTLGWKVPYQKLKENKQFPG